jgi:hypothetical protein
MLEKLTHSTPTPFHKIYHHVGYKVAVCTLQLSGKMLHTPPISSLPIYYTVIVTKEISVYDPNILLYVLQFQVSVCILVYKLCWSGKALQSTE